MKNATSALAAMAALAAQERAQHGLRRVLHGLDRMREPAVVGDQHDRLRSEARCGTGEGRIGVLVADERGYGN